jgi:hypothetical protein
MDKSLCSSTVRLFRTCRPTRPTVCPVASPPRRLVALSVVLPPCRAVTPTMPQLHTHPRPHTHTPAVIAAPPASHVCYDAAAVASLDTRLAPSPPPPPPSTRRRCCHLQARPPRTAGRLLANCACTSSVPSALLSSPLLLPEGWGVMRHVPCAMWAACRPSCEL